MTSAKTPDWRHCPVTTAMLRDAVDSHGGQVVKSTGQGVFAASGTAPDAVAAALAGQLARRPRLTIPARSPAFRLGPFMPTGQDSRGRDPRHSPRRRCGQPS
jgi:hypothetical protein